MGLRGSGGWIVLSFDRTGLPVSLFSVSVLAAAFHLWYMTKQEIFSSCEGNTVSYSFSSLSNPSLKTVTWAHSPVFGPNSHMVVQVVREVVGHQVFARHTDVHGVPVLKLPSQPLQMLFRDVCLGERRRLKEDEVPDISGHLLRSVGERKENGHCYKDECFWSN